MIEWAGCLSRLAKRDTLPKYDILRTDVDEILLAVFAPSVLLRPHQGATQGMLRKRGN
jgi:hypothetical protein